MPLHNTDLHRPCGGTRITNKTATLNNSTTVSKCCISSVAQSYAYFRKADYTFRCTTFACHAVAVSSSCYTFRMDLGSENGKTSPKSVFGLCVSVRLIAHTSCLPPGSKQQTTHKPTTACTKLCIHRADGWC